MRIPFVPFPVEKAVKISKPFIGLADKAAMLLPGLNTKLTQAEIKLRDREYISIAILSAIFWFSIAFCLMFSFLPMPFFAINIMLAFQISFFVSLAISTLSFIYIILYPTLIVTKRVKAVEKNLLFALRHLLIQVKSGVTLFDGMVSVAKGDYGLVSKEFDRCTKNISTGTPEIEAINEMALRNPSLHFRRILWQLANAMKAGADVGNALTFLVENLSNEQRVEIRRYGSQLNPLALMYMMLTVIIPSLGITFLFIISSFSGLPISQEIFYFILGALVIFQFMFIGLVKSRRPGFEI